MKLRRSRLLWVGLPVVTVFTVFVVIVWLAYQENARVPPGEPPLIRAIAAPYKLAPDDPGGRQVADQGEINELLRDDPGPAQPERVLPLPEEPRTPIIGAASRGETAPPAAVDAGQVPATTAGAASGTPLDAPAQSASAADDADATQEAEAALARLLADVGPEAVIGRAAGGSRTLRASDAGSGCRRSGHASRPAALDHGAHDRHGVTRPRRQRRSMRPRARLTKRSPVCLPRSLACRGTSSPEPQAAAEPPQAVAAIAPADPVESQRTMGPGFRVQLAAVREQDDARRAWADLADRLGSLVADYEPFYERAETVNGVFYRIQLGPFASEQTADRLCVEVQRRNASCFVVARLTRQAPAVPPWSASRVCD